MVYALSIISFNIRNFNSLRFALAHEGNKCRRGVILEHFGEDLPSATSEAGCCDVCSCTAELTDHKAELATVVRTVLEVPGYGEVKVYMYSIHSIGKTKIV